MTIFDDGHLNIIRFCAIECELQMSGERSVFHMLNAWEYASNVSSTESLQIQDIIFLGGLVEPQKNANGFRTVPVWVGNNPKLPHILIPNAMEDLVDNKNLSPELWFYEYENIHPFIDGNGRTGAILYNWLKDTLDNPIWPPNFWNDTRRKPNEGAPAQEKS